MSGLEFNRNMTELRKTTKKIPGDGRSPTVMEENVTKLAPGLLARKMMKTLILPKTLRHIRDEAFAGVVSLRRLIFAEDCKLSSIGENCFSGTVLKEIEFPVVQQEISGSAFNDFNSLRAVWVERGQIDYVKQYVNNNVVVLDRHIMIGNHRL